jgi:hypothetical protein
MLIKLTEVALFPIIDLCFIPVVYLYSCIFFLKQLQAEEHLNYCRGAIRVYTTAAETLQRRIAEGSVGTSREDDPVQIQSKKAEENERSNNEKEKAEKDSSIPQTSTQEEERYCI